MSSENYLVISAEESGVNAASMVDEDDNGGRDSLFTEDGTVSLGYLMDKNYECCELAVKGDLVSLSIAIDKIHGLRTELSSHSLHSTSISNNAVHLFAQRYRCTNDIEDLDLCIEAGSDMANPSSATETDPQDAFERSLRVGLVTLGVAHRWRFELQGDTKDLQLAISCTSKGLSLAGSEEDGSIAEQWSILGKWCYELFARTHDIKDVNMSIESYEKALKANYDHPLEANFSLAHALRSNFDMTSDMKILDRCIEVMQEVIRISPPEEQDRPQHYANLSYCFQKRFEVSDKGSDLDLAITSLQEAHGLVMRRSGGQRTFSIAPIEQVTRDPEAADTERRRREYIKMIPKDAKEGEMLSIRLSDLLLKRWQRNGTKDDLDSSVSLATYAEGFFQKDSEMYQKQSRMAREVLRLSWDHHGNVGDLDGLILSLRSHIDSLPEGHPEKLMYQMALALHQLNRYSTTGKTDDLESVYNLAQFGRKNDNSPERVRWLEILATVQEARSLLSGDPSLMEDAMQLAYQAIKQLESEDSTEPWLLFRMGERVARLCQQSGSIRQLDRGIEAMRQSLGHMDASSETTAQFMLDLAWWHMVRGDRTGDMRDVSYAIQLGEKAYSICHSAKSLVILSQCYSARSKRSSHPEDFDRSIQMLERWPEDKHGPGAMDLRQRFAALLTDRGKMRKSPQDINASIAAHQRCLDTFPQGGQNWIGCHYGLGMAFQGRWILNPKSLDDIEEAIAVFIKIKDQVLLRDLRGLTIHELGLCYQIRSLHRDPRDPLDAQQALTYFLECFRQPSSYLQLRIRSAINAAKVADSLFLPKEALKTLKEALDLLPALNLRSLTIEDQQEAITIAAGLATMATALEFKCDPQSNQALNILERGRGIITSLLLEEQTVISKLDPKLASEFMEAKRGISAMHSVAAVPPATHPNPGTQIQAPGLNAGARHAAENRLLEVIKRIEDDPKTKAFFDPPSTEEIFAALGDDNIAVINVSEFQCDAVVMSRRTGIRQATLPHLLLEDIDIQAKKLRDSRPMIDPSLLHWLWYMIGEPVTSALELKVPTKGQPLPRLFWILTGSLAQLPVHAAGRHHEGTKKTVLDRAISSYCSSLRSFVNSRAARLPSSPQGGGQNKALLVAMNQTPNHSPLVNATKEVDAVENMCGQLRLQPHRLPKPTRTTVLGGLDAHVFHFAGHGRSEARDPSQSGLLLNDGPLTVAEIREHKSDGKLPFLGFLSACLTAANDSKKLADESIHLLTACQVAGFRHLIGSLWQLYDDACVGIAHSFYKNLLSTGSEDRSVCEALHLTCVQSRDLWVAESLMAATDLSDKSPSNGSDAADGDVSPGTAGSENDPRDVILVEERPQGVNLVKADWVPYVHYGP